MGSINWSGFDWQAFSTLATGALAVLGATIVGVRQTMISKRQNEILERQTELEELKLKSELYDRRMEVFDAVNTYIFDALYTMKYDPEMEARFQQAYLKSKFLFRDSISRTIEEIAERGVHYIGLKLALARLENLKDSATEEDLQSLKNVREREKKLSPVLVKYLEDLPQIFGHELQLGTRTDPDAQLPIADPYNSPDTTYQQ